MKDKLRELITKHQNYAKSMRAEPRNRVLEFAAELLAILDAEGDGGAVGDAKEYLDNCVNALDHIARTARNCRVTSKRLTWIASRAESAISSNDDWRDAPVPKNGASALLRAQARIKELEAELSHPARSGVVSDEDVRDAERYRWLRVQGFDVPADIWVTTVKGNIPIVHSDLDEAIDAAIKGERHER